ncbi:MAG: ABC transporter ATP-binding protein [Gammaproteobacteria bacterium]
MIQLAQITRIFDVGEQKVHALNNINLQIDMGEYISIMGPSGSGKSTLLHILGLLDSASSGTYRLDDQDVTTLSDEKQAQIRRQKLGFVFQFFHLIPRLSAAENIALPLTLAGVAPEERQQRVHDILKAMDMIDRADHRPDQLSGGQRQRVAIARATIMQPRVLLADEPTGNLDSESGQEVINILENLNQNNLTLVIVTHDQALGDRATRQIKMVDGNIISDSGSELLA